MPELQAQLDAVTIRRGLWWLFVAWPFAVAVALTLSARLEALRVRARWMSLGGGAAGLGLGAWAAMEVTADHWQWWPGIRALRVGSLDVSLGIALDPLAAGMALALLVLCAGALGLASEALGDDPSGAAVSAVARLPLIVGAALYAAVADNWVALALGWLGAGLAARALADDLAPNGPRGGVIAGRLGDAALLAAVALSFWGSGGRWLEDGYRPDYRARFIAVTAPAAQAGLPSTPRLAQRVPGTALPEQLPRPPALRTKPNAVPEKRGPVAPMLPTVGGRTAYLSMTTHPGAEIYFGITELADLKANLGALPRCEEGLAWEAPEGPQMTVSCVATAPFVDKRIAPGIHRIAVVPGSGGVVGGRGDEAAELELRVEPDAHASIVAIGATVGFIDANHQRRVAAKLGLPAPLDAPARKRGAGWLFLLAALGMAASATQFCPQRAADASLRRATPVLVGAAQAVPLLLAGHLLARASTLGVALPQGGALLGAVVALGAALAAWHPRAGGRILTWLALAHAGAVVAALGLASAQLAVALGLGHAALWIAAMGPLALDEKDGGSWDEPLGLRSKLPRWLVYSIVGATLTVAGILPMGGFFGRAAGLAGLPSSASPPRWIAWGGLLAAQLGVALATGRFARLVLSGAPSRVAGRVGHALRERRRFATVSGVVALVWLASGVVATVSAAAWGGKTGLWRTWMGREAAGSVTISGLVLAAGILGLVRSTPGEGAEPSWSSAGLRSLHRGGELASSAVSAADGLVVRGLHAIVGPLEPVARRLGARGAVLVAALVVVALVGWVAR